jgi:hypothetical protein
LPPVAALLPVPPGLAVLLLSLLPHPESASVAAAARAARPAHFDVAIDAPVPCSDAPFGVHTCL